MKTSAFHMRSAFAGLSRAVGFLGAVVSTDAQVTLAPGRRPVVDPHNILRETGPSRRKWRATCRAGIVTLGGLAAGSVAGETGSMQ